MRLADQLRVAVVCKGPLNESSTYYAQGGIAAVSSPEDSVDDHVADTLNAGAGLCHEDVVRFVVERGPALIEDLMKLGVEFDRRPAKSSDETGEFDLGLDVPLLRLRTAVTGGNGGPECVDQQGLELHRRSIAKLLRVFTVS